MRTRHKTWVLLPPADPITPEVARRWLHRSYPPLARLALLAAYPDWIMGMRGVGLRKLERERALMGMKLIGGDVRRITEACGKTPATGRAVPMKLDPDRLRDHPQTARDLRATLKYEARRPQRSARRRSPA